MKKCLENLDRILPVFDKIFNKTLCLQNYLLNDGHCQGLSDACENLDPSIVNRMLFNNCGLSGEQMAVLLDGFAKMVDLKALIYKNNSLNALSIEKLSPLLDRRAPNHLLELQIVDCKMTPTLVELLMDQLLRSSRLKKLNLVKLQHSERSFEKLGEYVTISPWLRELDVSWSGVRPIIMLRFLQVLKVNTSLQNINLSFNKLVEK